MLGARPRWHILAAALLLVALANRAAASNCVPWAEWQSFKADMLSADGRVIDRSSPELYTVSEGQSYALFFALVANEPQVFAKVLEWTENNLAEGDFTKKLPAWQWGLGAGGKWHVTDANPASDSDLWISYALGEAGRLWNNRRYRVLSALIAQRVLAEETADIPGLGVTLLPGPEGFTLAADLWRLNPSYVPLQLMRWFAAHHEDAGWDALVDSSLRLIVESAPRGYVPDWVVYQDSSGFMPDTQTQAGGSYNAIRVYLWAGMLPARDPARARLVAALKPMADFTAAQGAPPEYVDTRNGAVKNPGPRGFSGALLPLLSALGNHPAAAVQYERSKPVATPMPAYYDSVLSLFGRGFHEGRYRFAENGALQLPWKNRQCALRS